METYLIPTQCPHSRESSTVLSSPDCDRCYPLVPCVSPWPPYIPHRGPTTPEAGLHRNQKHEFARVGELRTDFQKCEMSETGLPKPSGKLCELSNVFGSNTEQIEDVGESRRLEFDDGEMR
jgi:hypothetical protein